jgi:hypothetical protein
MIRDRVLAAFDRHKHRLAADFCRADLFSYDNDLGVVAIWGDIRHGVRANDFIPAGGMSDDQIDTLVSACIDKLAAWREAHS